MNSFLTTLSQQPIISTIGVNPDLLQFYISTPNNELNFMIGNYQHYYVSGVVTSFSLEKNYVSFQLPSFHYLSRDLYYRLSPSCIQNHHFLPDCSNDADILMQYAYTIEVEEIPYTPKSLICIIVISRISVVSLVDENSLFAQQFENNWPSPSFFSLYEDLRIHGISFES